MPEDKKKKRGIFDKISDAGKDFAEGIVEGIEGSEAYKSSKESFSAKKDEKKQQFRTYKDDVVSKAKTRMEDTSSPEQVYYSSWTWFWAMIFGVFLIFTLMIMTLVNPKFLLFNILLLLAIPFWIIWCLIHMIPEIRILGFTIFSRKQLSLRRQLSLGKEIARLFSRQFYQESPEAFFIFYIFIAFILLAILLAIF